MKRDGRGVVYVLIGLLLLGGSFWGMVQPGEVHYEYEVKSEQVDDAQRINDNDVTQYDNLSEPEKEVLFHAYKKSDHFLGGASATVETEQKLNLTEKWRVVEIKGVPVLVGFHGPERVEEMNPISFFSTFVLFGGGFVILVGLARLKIIAEEPKV